jgi:NAD(P)-dependent dehydrogenase (short-subunit alcohol dehydrogenase family)
MFDFTGANVLVTGAASGIGLGIAEAFYRSGARVALADFRAEALERAIERFAERERVFTGIADVRDAASTAAVVDAAEAALGSITIAVAAAGIYPSAPVLEMTVEQWDRVMETNARGVFLTCQTVARRLVERGMKGKLVTVASTASQIGRPGAAHYCASKAAVVMLTKVLALELAARGITVNAIAPTLVEVEGGISPVSREFVEATTRFIPLGRPGRPADVANAALFLASPESEFITGHVLFVDGGTTAGRGTLPLINS